MNVGRAEIHPFSAAHLLVRSRKRWSEARPAGENLYLAVATPPGTNHGPIIPKKFYDLVPHLKASDFDYIIFDMPPLNQTSITLATAGYMDKVVLVAEAEKATVGL
jgi:Mrp family chromosome partitioning ATPase